MVFNNGIIIEFGLKLDWTETQVIITLPLSYTTYFTMFATDGGPGCLPTGVYRAKYLTQFTLCSVQSSSGSSGKGTYWCTIGY